MDMKITRKDLCDTIQAIYSNMDSFLVDVEANMSPGFEVFCSIKGNPGDSDILIMDTTNGLYICWYKLYHVGRDMKSNIPDLNRLRIFIEAFKQTVK